MVTPPPTDTKTCTACHEDKPNTEFNRNRAARDGLYHRCRPCNNAQSRASGQRTRESPARQFMLALPRPPGRVQLAWTDEVAAMALGYWGIPGGFISDQKSGSKAIVSWPGFSHSGVEIGPGSIASDDLLTGKAPSAYSQIKYVDRVNSMVQSRGYLVTRIWSQQDPVNGSTKAQQYMECTNPEGELASARVGNWDSGRDSFLPSGTGLTLDDLVNPSQTYVVVLPSNLLKIGRGRMRSARTQHGGTHEYTFPSPSRWHAAVTEALTFEALITHHAPLPKGTLPNCGDSEVFSCDPYLAIETMACIADHVNTITPDQAHHQHKVRARTVASTSKRLHARQNRIHPTPDPSP